MNQYCSVFYIVSPQVAVMTPSLTVTERNELNKHQGAALGTPVTCDEKTEQNKVLNRIILKQFIFVA